MRHSSPPPSDRFRLRFEDDWFDDDITSKYNDYMSQTNGHVKNIVALINSTIKGVVISGFNADVETQEQGGGLSHITKPMLGTKSWVQALNQSNVEIEMFHVDSYLTWGFWWENIRKQFSQSHKDTIKSYLKIDILNQRNQKAFDFTFKDCIITTLDDIQLDAATNENDFGNFKIGIAFAYGSADFPLFDVKTPKT